MDDGAQQARTGEMPEWWSTWAGRACNPASSDARTAALDGAGSPYHAVIGLYCDHFIHFQAWMRRAKQGFTVTEIAEQRMSGVFVYPFFLECSAKPNLK